MKLSIYLMIPLIWLAVILLFAITKAAYEHGVDKYGLMPIATFEPVVIYPELQKISYKAQISDREPIYFLDNPNILEEETIRHLHHKIYESIKQFIRIDKYYIDFDHRKIYQATLLVAKKQP